MFRSRRTRTCCRSWCLLVCKFHSCVWFLGAHEDWELIFGGSWCFMLCFRFLDPFLIEFTHVISFKNIRHPFEWPRFIDSLIYRLTMRSSLIFRITVPFILLHSILAQDCEFIAGEPCTPDSFLLGCCSNTQLAVCGNGATTIEIIQCADGAVCELDPDGDGGFSCQHVGKS
jgi:hypothetical protein